MTTLGQRWYIALVMIGAAVLRVAQPCMGLVVSELMYHPADPTEAIEFIELYNDQTVSEDLSGYAFTNGIKYAFQPGTILAPKGCLVVARDPNALETAYGISGVYGPFTGRLSNSGERIELSNGNGAVAISFRYGVEKPWPVSPDGTGHSLILAKLGGDPQEASSWAPSTYLGGTPGKLDEIQVRPAAPTTVTLIGLGSSGRYFKGTKEPSPGPDGQATTSWTRVEFGDSPARSAWLDGPNGYGYSGSAAEQALIQTYLSDMNGNYISLYVRLRFTLTAEQIASFAHLLAEVNYDDDFVLYLNGTRVAASTGITGNPPPFNAGRGAGWEPPVENVDLTDQMDLLVPGTNVLAIQVHNNAISGSSDCFAAPILKALVGVSQSGDNPQARVAINELQVNTDAQPSAGWIELYNPGPVAVDLGSLYLSTDPLDLLCHKIPNGIVLQPGQCWTVAEGTPPNGIPLGLSAAGGTIYLTAATGDPEPKPVRVIDALRYEAMEPNVTFGRFPDGSESLDFLSSATPGQRNARPAIGDIVINEIMYHHPTQDERYEYVELYNKGADTVSLGGWAFTDGIEYAFAEGCRMPPDSYLVVAKDPDFLAGVYPNLVAGSNLVGPYSGSLANHSDRIRLSHPLTQVNQRLGRLETYMVTEDEVTYYDGGRWPTWADGQGASLELRDPRSNNDTPDAWADSNETARTAWKPFSFTISGSDTNYTHDQVTIFDLLLLNRGEVLLDDIELLIDGTNRLANGGFEAGESFWRILGNHVQSFVTSEDRHSGSFSLHLIATGHGDPGANRINQSIIGVTGGTVTFRGWARWVRGSPFLLLRASRELSPVQPPRPAYAFELDMPRNPGTPGLKNTAFVPHRGPDIGNVRHTPTLPAAGEPIVVTARVTDNDGISAVMLYYRSEGSTQFESKIMSDDGSGNDQFQGDSVFTATIPGVPAGTMRSFYIEASDGAAASRFPTRLEPSATVPDRTCQVRVGDTQLSTQTATYRIWLSNAVIDAFRSRSNLSNELMDCTFVYNDREVFYNAQIRFRGSPFLRPGVGWDPRDRHAFRIEFNPEQRFRDRQEINLDNTEGDSRGPLQERASYWFFRQLGLPYSTQEFVRLIINGTSYGNYEDVQKIDDNYIQKWFADDADGYIHEKDDYFEYDAGGTSQSIIQEGIKVDAQHPLLKETYRWGFEKRSHHENDDWQHVFAFAVAMNTPSSSSLYEQTIESVIHPEHFARVIAIRHANGDWDSYGYRRGKNCSFYYAPSEGKWYLLPWDLDFTLGSGDGPTTSLFSMDTGQFPEVNQFLNYRKYRQMYLQAFADLVNGPWKTSYGTTDPPTAFDRFLDDAANALIADGLGTGRRDGIKQFVRDRRAYILTQIPAGLIQP